MAPVPAPVPMAALLVRHLVEKSCLENLLRSELIVLQNAAHLGMSRLAMHDPAWRLFDDIWRASARLELGLKNDGGTGVFVQRNDVDSGQGRE